jgi:hypothetical protein
MSDFLEIPFLDKKAKEKILREIEGKISRKKKEGVYSEKEIREIEELKLRPIPDLLDVQSVYKDVLFPEES